MLICYVLWIKSMSFHSLSPCCIAGSISCDIVKPNAATHTLVSVQNYEFSIFKLWHCGFVTGYCKNSALYVYKKRKVSHICSYWEFSLRNWEKLYIRKIRAGGYFVWFVLIKPEATGLWNYFLKRNAKTFDVKLSVFTFCRTFTFFPKPWNHLLPRQSFSCQGSV